MIYNWVVHDLKVTLGTLGLNNYKSKTINHKSILLLFINKLKYPRHAFPTFI